MFLSSPTAAEQETFKTFSLYSLSIPPHLRPKDATQGVVLQHLKESSSSALSFLLMILLQTEKNIPQSHMQQS